MNAYRALVILIGLMGPICGNVAAADPIELETLDGHSVRPLEAWEAKFAVVIFITTDCPIANVFMPEIGRLAKQAAELGGKVTLAHVDWDLSVEAARQHAKDYAIRVPVVIDREHQIVKKTKARVTPEAVVLDQKGSVVYQGAINDLYVDFGDRRRVATRHFVRDAMNAAAKGEKPPTASQEPVGCFIPELD